jgi:tetrahedral aminopeptidase
VKNTQQDFNFEILEKFLKSPGISGYESKIQQIFMNEVKSFVDQLEQDSMGNVFTFIQGLTDKNVLITGHCDEVGLLVKYIDENGFLYFHPIGKIDPHILPGKKVLIDGEKKQYHGIIGRKPVYLLSIEEQKHIIPLEDQYIDIGASSSEEVKSMGIKVGDPIVLIGDFHKLGLSSRVTGRCLDNRIGIYILHQLMKNFAHSKPSCSIIGLSSTQEEVGHRGIKSALKKIGFYSPLLAIVIDTYFSSDTPDVSPKLQGKFDLGKGPIISRGIGTNHTYFLKLCQIAKKFNIPIQIEGSNMPKMDAEEIEQSNGGIPTLIFSVPTRYIHTSQELVDLEDVNNLMQLIIRFLESI